MYHKKRTFKIFAVAAHPEALCKVTLSALHSFLILCGYIAEVHTGGEKAGGHAGKMDKNVFGDYAVALSPSFILGSSLSLSPKSCHLLGSSCKLWIIYGSCWSGCFCWDKAMSSTIRTTMTSVLTLSLLPSSHEHSQSDNGAVCRSVACPTALHTLTDWLSLFFLLLKKHRISREM